MADRTVVQAMDPGKENSPIAGPIDEQSTVMLDSASKVCVWNGQEFKEGQVVECDGVGYECSLGQWIKES